MHDLHDPGAKASELLRDDDTTMPSRVSAAPGPVSGGMAEPHEAVARSAVARPRSARPLLARVARYAILIVAGLLIVVIAHLAVYRFFDPPFTTLTAARWIAGEAVEQTWVPLNRISPQLLRAVIASEDARFCQHWGVDPGALEAAIEDWWSGTPRGGSTISMQVVKNLFLWPQRSVVRKAVELPLALVLELLWPKQRILEVYLNIAEWGPNVFGAEAAARYHFDKSASALGVDEAARLAVSLPNPIARDAGDPNARLLLLADLIGSRMRSANVSCIALPDRR